MGDLSESLAAVEECARQSAEGFRCDRVGAGHRLDLWGRLPADWVGSLGLHFYHAGIHVVKGDAMRTERGVWLARFDLETAHPRTPLDLDFLVLARCPSREEPPLPVPSVSISVRSSLEQPGSAYASVRGKDTVGLLAHLLDHFERFGFRPRRFVLRTRADEVDDWFWLDPAAEQSRRLSSLEAMERAWCGPEGTLAS